MLTKKPRHLVSLLCVCIFLVLLTLTQAQARVEMNIVLPDRVHSGTPFTVNLVVTNNSQQPISFDRIALAYVLPDLTVRGPYEKLEYGYVAAGATDAFATKFTITLPKSVEPGTIIPVMVSLFQSGYNKAGARGSGVGGVKVVY